MNRKLLIMLLFVLGLVAIVVFLFTQKTFGEVVFESDIYPYTIQVASDSEVQSFDCENSECRLELVAGDYDVYMEKEGYYAEFDSFSLGKGEKVEIAFEFDVIPGLVASEVSLDEAIFEVCYGDWDACGYGDLYSMEKDESTGYMTLWEGEVRRATFTKGMADSKIFVGGNGVLVWDTDSGEAYFVDFLEDSREYLFTASGLEEVMFASGDYIVSGDFLHWFKDGVLEKLPFSGGLAQLTYQDGRIYFVADGSELSEDDIGVVVGSYDGESVYIIVDGLEIDVDSSVIASDKDGVYVKSGGDVFKLLKT